MYVAQLFCVIVCFHHFYVQFKVPNAQSATAINKILVVYKVSFQYAYTKLTESINEMFILISSTYKMVMNAINHGKSVEL